MILIDSLNDYKYVKTFNIYNSDFYFYCSFLSKTQNLPQNEHNMRCIWTLSLITFVWASWKYFPFLLFPYFLWSRCDNSHTPLTQNCAQRVTFSRPLIGWFPHVLLSNWLILTNSLTSIKEKQKWEVKPVT